MSDPGGGVEALLLPLLTTIPSRGLFSQTLNRQYQEDMNKNGRMLARILLSLLFQDFFISPYLGGILSTWYNETVKCRWHNFISFLFIIALSNFFFERLFPFFSQDIHFPPT